MHPGEGEDVGCAAVPECVPDVRGDIAPVAGYEGLDDGGAVTVPIRYGIDEVLEFSGHGGQSFCREAALKNGNAAVDGDGNPAEKSCKCEKRQD